MSCRRHDEVRPPRFEGDPRNCAFPSGWGRRTRPPANISSPPPPWWAGWFCVLFFAAGAMFVFFAIRGLLR